MSANPKRGVVQPYLRLGGVKAADNPFPNVGAGADAIRRRTQSPMNAQGRASGPNGPQDDLRRQIINQIMGFSETTLQPLTRTSELIGRADPEGYLTATSPGLFVAKRVGDEVLRGLDRLRRHGHQPGLAGRVAGEALLLAAPPVAAVVGADKYTGIGEALDKAADRVGAAETKLADGIRQWLSPSSRAGLRGRRR
jgi:hypothetical protein